VIGKKRGFFFTRPRAPAAAGKLNTRSRALLDVPKPLELKLTKGEKNKNYSGIVVGKKKSEEKKLKIKLF
jgi:hypothetical protein